MQGWHDKLESEGLTNATVQRDGDSNFILFCRNHFVGEFMQEGDARLIAEIINDLTK